jgi:hypothetical protein
VALGGRKVIERYPLTPEGWERAWRALVALDPVAAQHILPVLPPDELRIHLVRGIGAVRQAQELTAGPDDTDPRADAASVVTELARLAGLLEAGLLTRPEFDQLKAGLLARQPPDASR